MGNGYFKEKEQVNLWLSGGKPFKKITLHLREHCLFINFKRIIQIQCITKKFQKYLTPLIKSVILNNMIITIYYLVVYPLPITKRTTQGVDDSENSPHVLWNHHARNWKQWVVLHFTLCLPTLTTSTLQYLSM